MSLRRELKAAFKNLLGLGGDTDNDTEKKNRKKDKKEKAKHMLATQLPKDSASNLSLQKTRPICIQAENAHMGFIKNEMGCKEVGKENQEVTLTQNAPIYECTISMGEVKCGRQAGECIASEKEAQVGIHLIPALQNLVLDVAPEPKGPWEKALSKLSVQDRIDLLHRPPTAGSLPSEQAVISAILTQSQQLLEQSEKRAWKFRSPFTGEMIPLREKVHKFVMRVNTYAQLGDRAVQSSPQITALAWAGVRFLINLVAHDAENWGVILETMEGVAASLGRCRIYERLYAGEQPAELEGGKRVMEQLVKLYASMLRFSVKARRYFSNSNRKRVVAELLNPFQLEFQPIIDEMRQGEETLEQEARAAADELAARDRHENRALNADQMAILHHLEAILSELSSASIRNINISLNQANATAQVIRKAQEEEERLAILQFLSQVKYLEHHKAARKVRQEGTGKWLFERMEWKNWFGLENNAHVVGEGREEELENEWWVDLDNSNEGKEPGREEDHPRGLWLYGLPGTGKTILTSNIIDYLSALTKPAFPAAPSPDAVLAYFYCSYIEASRRQVTSLMATILKQLVIQLNPHPDNDTTGLGLPKMLVSRYRSYKEEGFSAEQFDLAEMEEIIYKEVLPSPGLKRVYIVIDALDEMEESSRKDLFPILSRLLNYDGICQVKIFISSRGGMRDIKNTFEKEGWIKMGLAKEDTGEDIASFVHKEILNVVESGELLEGEIEEELKQEVIQTLVNGADGMFLWVRYQISHICEQETEYDVVESLKNLPRNLEQTYSNLLDKINLQSFNRKRLAERVLKWMLCSSRPLTPRELAEAVAIEPMVDKELNSKKLVKGVEAIIGICGNFIAYDEQTGVLRFVHFSVREFLEMKFCTMVEANSAVAEVCLTFLTFVQQLKLLDKQNAPEQKEKKADGEEGATNKTVVDKGKELALTEYIVMYWGDHLRISTSPLGASIPEVLGILIDRFFNLQDTYFLRWLSIFQQLDNSFRINLFEPGIDKLQPDPFYVACHFELIPIAKQLVLRGSFLPNEPIFPLIDREEKNPAHWSYLHLAAATASHHVLRALISEFSSDVNILDIHGRNALHIVASSRRTCQGGAAIFLSHDEALTTKYLIQSGTDPMKQDGKNKATPLHLASENGNISVIRALTIYTESLNSTLPSFGNLWNIKDTWGKTALHSAVTSKRLLARGKYEIVMHLIALGSPVNVKDSFNRNVLERLLIECPGEVNTTGQFLYDVGVEYDEQKLAPGVPKMVMGKKVVFREFGKAGHFGVGHVMYAPQVGWWRNLNAGWIGKKGMTGYRMVMNSMGDRGFRDRVRMWCENGK